MKNELFRPNSDGSHHKTLMFERDKQKQQSNQKSQNNTEDNFY